MPRINGPSSCLERTNAFDFFTKQDNVVSRKSKMLGLFDKSLKVLKPSFQLASEISYAVGGDKVGEGFSVGAEVLETGRDLIAIPNIIRGVIPSVVVNTEIIRRILANLLTGDQNPVSLQPSTVLFDSPKKLDETDRLKPYLTLMNYTETEVMSDRREVTRKFVQYGKYNDFAVTTQEKLLSLIVCVGRWVGGVTYIIGFGVMRPIHIVDKHILKEIKVELDATAAKIAKMFPTCMMINHIGGIIEHGTDLYRLNVMIKRAKANAAEHGEDISDKMRQEYHHKRVDNWLGLGAKATELFFIDTFHHLKHQLPPVPRAIIALAVSVFEFAKEVHKD